MFLLAVTRLVPLFPFNLQNFAYGVTDIRFAPYALYSALFILPGTAAYTIGAAGIVDGENRVLLIAIAVVLFAVSFAVAWFLKKKADIETRNKAEAYINQIDETLKTDNANVTPEQKAEVQKLRDELQKAIDDNDMDGLKTKLDALEQAANAMAQQMYQNGGTAGAGNAGSASGNAGDDVVDADFTEKN